MTKLIQNVKQNDCIILAIYYHHMSLANIILTQKLKLKQLFL